MSTAANSAAVDQGLKVTVLVALDQVDIQMNIPCVQSIQFDIADFKSPIESLVVRISGIDFQPTTHLSGTTLFRAMEHLHGPYVTIHPACFLHFDSPTEGVDSSVRLLFEVIDHASVHASIEQRIDILPASKMRADFSTTRFIKSLVPHHPETGALSHELQQQLRTKIVGPSEVLPALPSAFPTPLLIDELVNDDQLELPNTWSKLEEFNQLRIRASILLRAGFDLLIDRNQPINEPPAVALVDGHELKPISPSVNLSAFADRSNLLSIRDQIDSGCYPIPLWLASDRGRTRCVFVDLDSDGETAIHQSTGEDSELDVPLSVRVWKNELLGIDFRSRLLNFDPMRRGIPLNTTMTLGDIENLLNRSSPLTIVSQDQSPDPTTSLVTTQTPQDLLERARVLISDNRTFRRNNGSNNLFLVLGLLRWAVPDRPDLRVDSPIFLVPIQLSLDSKSGIVSIRQDPTAAISPNVALFEALRRRASFSNDWANSLPRDDWGLDVEQALNGLQRLLSDSPTVLKDATILPGVAVSLLDFSNSRLWLDLDSNWKLFANSPVVRTLAGLEPANIQIPAHLTDPPPILPVFEIDRFQSNAIQQALSGVSFVLEGPPGSGKSQTIACLIANAMLQGKSILFAAEKDVALSAVRSRLDTLGLLRYCIDLSPEVGGTYAEFRRQVEGALVESRVIPEHDVEMLMQREIQLENEMRIYASGLHEATPSVYQLGSELVRINAPSLLNIGSQWARLDDDGKHSLLNRLEEVLEEVGSIGERARRMWPRFLEPSSIDDVWRSSLVHLASQLETQREALKMVSGVRSLDKMTTSEVLTLFFLATHGADNLQSADLQNKKLAPERLSILVGRIHDLKATEAITDPQTRRLALEVDLTSTIKAIEAETTDTRLGQTQRLRAVVQDHRLDELLRNVQPQDYLSVLYTVDKLRVLELSISTEVVDSLGILPHPDWTPLLPNAIETLVVFAQGLTKLLQRSSGFDFVLSRLGQLKAVAPSELVAISAVVGGAMVLFDLDDQDFEKWIGESDLDITLAAGCGFWQSEAQFGDFPSLHQLRSVQTKLVQLEMDGLPTLRQDFDLAFADVDEFLKVVKSTRLTYKLQKRFTTTPLSDYGDTRLDSLVNESTDLGSKIRNAAPTQVAKIVQDRIQQHQINNGGRDLLAARVAAFKSIREFIGQTFDSLSVPFPCFIGTPDSIARRLDPSQCRFDIVVLDEASQITPENALGVIGRGRSCVIVGDSKQMPPTRVGKLRRLDGSNDESLVSPDSVLSLGVIQGLHSILLRWHYRSESESLIAFSNAQYYNQTLLTYPENTSFTAPKAVSFRRVDGQFDHGGSRTNLAEAEAMVDELRLRVNQHSQCSLALIVMNIEQQALIEEIIVAQRDPLINKLLQSEDDRNSIAVLNLESSQGMERDYVLIGTCYSKEAGTDSVPLRFGGLIGSSGQRRLNVAITRARREMVVFSSFDPEAITSRRDLTSAGVIDLGLFMQYARDGLSENQLLRDARHPDLALLESVCLDLRHRGFEAQARVGMSDFRVDLAVKKSESDHWDLGILIDGLSWFERSTIRERIIAPQHALAKFKGWPSIRVLWAVDWMRRPALAAEQIARWLHDS